MRSFPRHGPLWSPSAHPGVSRLMRAWTGPGRPGPDRPPPGRLGRRPPRPCGRLTRPGPAAERWRLGLSASAAFAPQNVQRLAPRSPLPSLADEPSRPGHRDRPHEPPNRRPAAIVWPEPGPYRQVTASATGYPTPHSAAPRSSQDIFPSRPHLRRSSRVGRTTPRPCLPTGQIPTTTPRESVPTTAAP